MPITSQGMQIIKEKLKEVKEDFEKMPNIIAEAREKGDLKENAEYHAAKERQGMLNAEMSKLNADISTSQVIDLKTLPLDIITFGKKIRYKNLTENKTLELSIVGPAEATFFENAYSINSVFIKGILGKKIGDNITVKVPSGEISIEILSIDYL